MERGRAAFEAQVSYDNRSIFRTPCGHRLVCGTAHPYAGRLVHSDGLVFVDEVAAQRLDLQQTVLDGCGKRWHTFSSWGEALAWLARGCASP